MMRRKRTNLFNLCLGLCLLLLPGTVRASFAAQASAKIVDDGGTEVVIMENDWIRMTVNPAKGGRVSSFIVKSTGREMITSENSGLFLDHFYEQNWPGEFLNVPYEMELVSNGPREAAVRVSRMSTGKWGGSVNAGVAGIQIIRTLRLPADRPVIECEVELKNTETASKAFTYWQQQVYRADGDSGAESRQVMTHPSARGLHVVRPVNDWTRDPAAGWTAGTDPEDRVGLVFLMDYNALWALYNCMQSTSEWFFEKVLLPGEMSWKTQSTVVLVEGLEAVVHASPRLVADIHVSTKDGALCIEHVLAAASQPLPEAQVTTTLAWLNRSLAIGTQPSVSELKGIGREPQRVKAEFPGQAGKPFVIQVLIEGDGWNERYEFAYSGSGNGKEPGKQVDGYTITPPPKHRQIIKPPVLTKVKNEIPQVMHLRGLYYKLWRVEEAAGALGDSEIVPSYYKDVGDIQMLSVPPWDYDAIMKQDVIVFNNIGYGAMIGEQGTGMLMAYVESGGAVLFLGGPQAFGRGRYHESAVLKELLPVELTDAYDLHPLEPGTQLTATPGCPVSAVRWNERTPVALWMHTLAAKPDAEIWMSAGEQPAIVTRRVGKGRIAAILLTPLGTPARGETPYWESPDWPVVMTALLNWLMNGE